MHFDMRALDVGKRYRIIGNCITPRPIAWVTSRSADGVLNVAPFSFFNAIGNDPPMIVLGLVAHPERRFKDTATNIRDAGEFVVALVGEPDAEAMNLTSAEVAPDVDEAGLAGLTLAPAIEVAAPLIASAPANFECRMSHFIETGPHQVAILAEILHAHIRDDFITDPAKIVLDIPAMRLISRLHGAGFYGRSTDVFEMKRPG